MHQEKTENENLNWMEYITVAWKRRWLIVIPTVIAAVLAAVVSFLLPKVWQVDTIIIPSKFMTQTQTGEFKIVLVAEPKQIASQITEGSYDSLIAAEVNIPEREFPAIKAENLRDTNLVRASVREKDPQKGKRILDSLFKHLKSEFDIKIDIEISNLNNQIEMTKNKIRDLELNIESRKIEKEKTRRDIESDKNKFAISENRIGSIQVEMKSVRTRIAELDILQKKNMAEKKEGTETLALLLYSNEVQQNLRYFNTLDETLSAERVNIENLTYSIKSKEQQLLQIDNQVSQIQNNISNANNDIKLLTDKKGRIDYTQLIKVPTVSFTPVSPNKKQNVLMAAFIGFCLSLGIVFFCDYLEKQKKTGSPKV
jgi:uncharacterized protein involved in exopolysaccharide biosynthesis